MGMELEWKFSATDLQQEAVSAAYGPWQMIAMETTYYDTPEGLLSAQHVTLRRRMENGKSICTVKTPAAGGGRGEWECECDRIEDSIETLCKLGAPDWILSAAASGLQSVCGATFTRRAYQITLPDFAAEIALDSGILFGGNRQSSLCEIEVEYKQGDSVLAAAFATAFASRFGLSVEGKSKFRRALRLAQGE